MYQTGLIGSVLPQNNIGYHDPTEVDRYGDPAAWFHTLGTMLSMLWYGLSHCWGSIHQ